MGIKTGLLKYAVVAGFAIATSTAYGVPVLQIGAPGGSGEGTYANYTGSLTSPTESDTATTSGSTIYVAGVYQNNNILNLGGKFGTGSDWSAIDSAYPSDFNGKGAILLAAVPDGQRVAAVSSLQVNGNSAFFSSDTLSGLFPDNHAPLKDDVSDFLFFDIGNFTNTAGAVPDFTTETGAADGQIKTLTISGFGNLVWIHFDALAIETSSQGNPRSPRIVSTIDNNPGSHDVTWKVGGPPNVGGGNIPEPASLGLLGIGLLALSAVRRRKAA